MRLELNDNEYKVTAEGLTVELLPKEFALLRFLYLNKGRTFSREQLLDKVWPLEYPVERTVDDHIYRLRKKLGGFHGLTIRTVRGLGYSLAVQDTASTLTPPSIQDTALHETMREVFVKYHQYGQGRSMQTLARQQDVLGYELDPFYAVYVHFVQGDLEWLLHTTEAPLRDRLYSLMLFFMFTGDPADRLASCELLLEREILPQFQHQELKILNILDLYAVAGKTDIALERLKLTYTVIQEPEYENFELPVAISEMFVHLAAGTPDVQVAAMLGDIEERLSARPFLRESGSYNITKGLWKLRQKNWRDGEALLDEGLQILETSGFVPLLMQALHRIVYCGAIFSFPQALQAKYKKMFEAEQAARGLDQWLKPLEAVIRGAIHPL
ncbi:winged helix-turn-helix domain-containing protein [Paenibacillus sp. GCM10012306]|uniref:winged helix-turn-helix domain-containing protein n=1 Tax=Paenibacillus sp. GCM10012306 TaxID=3317342 RepID=UPI003611E4C1